MSVKFSDVIVLRTYTGLDLSKLLKSRYDNNIVSVSYIFDEHGILGYITYDGSDRIHGRCVSKRPKHIDCSPIRHLTNSPYRNIAYIPKRYENNDVTYNHGLLDGMCNFNSEGYNNNPIGTFDNKMLNIIITKMDDLFRRDYYVRHFEFRLSVGVIRSAVIKAGILHRKVIIKNSKLLIEYANHYFSVDRVIYRAKVSYTQFGEIEGYVAKPVNIDSPVQIRYTAKGALLTTIDRKLVNKDNLELHKQIMAWTNSMNEMLALDKTDIC